MSASVRPDILRWEPKRWEEIAGCKRPIRVFKQVVRKLRTSIEAGNIREFNRYAFLLAGPSRSGKTMLARFLTRCILCEKLDPAGLNPCDGTCWPCQQRATKEGLKGLEVDCFAEDDDVKLRVDFEPVDCPRIRDAEELQERIDSLWNSYRFDHAVVVYLDEAHRLARNHVEDVLLKAVEDRPFLWILSTARPGELDPMLRNRLTKLATELPDEAEMATWIAQRCLEWQIAYDPEAVIRVVEKSNRVVGTALHAIALASLDPESGLTVDLVENDWTLDAEGQ